MFISDMVDVLDLKAFCAHHAWGWLALKTSASWLNTVERFFRDVSENRQGRGVFTSALEFIVAIDGCIAHHSINPKPFIWTKSARDIFQKVIRANVRLSAKQNATLRKPGPARSLANSSCADLLRNTRVIESESSNSA